MSNNTPKQLEKQVEELELELHDANQTNYFLKSQLAMKNDQIVLLELEIKGLREQIEELAK